MRKQKMKSKFLITLTAVFVLAFAAAIYAFNKASDTGKATASCCAKSDNCPLKNKEAQQTTAENNSTASCCGNDDCCCKSGACPMKSSGEKGSTDCCGNCCGGSCPMKNKQTETVAVQTSETSCPHKTAGS
jgi:hypothetical protein